MALIEYDVYKQKLRDLEPELKKLGDALDIDAVAQEAARLEDETTQDGFWNNLERSQKVQTRLKQLQNKLHRFKKLMSTWEDLTTLCEMGQEAEDEEILEELKTEFPALETEIEEIRMTTLLSGEYDANNVILQLHSGAGGVGEVALEVQGLRGGEVGLELLRAVVGVDGADDPALGPLFARLILVKNIL